MCGIRPSTSIDLNRKIALVHQPRAATVVSQISSVSAPTVIQPCSSTSEAPTTIIRQANLLPETQKSGSSRENILKSEEISEDVCSDTNQLVRKTNSLPMEVT